MTELLYINDFDVETCVANVVSVSETDDGRFDIILDQTCFYPRGGGQDWDRGTITKDGIDETNIEEVHLDQDGVVHHICSSTKLSDGDEVSCTVDPERRLINTRLHSAGHVIDMAIYKLGLDWIATKGQHYPHLSAVEYSGTWDPEKADELRVALENKANEMVKIEQDNRLVFMPVKDLHTVCHHVPDNIPTNKPCRVVIYGEDYGIPCGGTHVKNLQQIGTMQVPKLKCKKGTIRVSYTVDGIN